MKRLLLVFSVLLCFSYIPLGIAPTIKTDKVMVAKKFKRKLPKQYAFIFEDPKDANEFYNYVNTKYELNHQNVEWNVPFEINNETLNFLPFLIDAKLEQERSDPMFEDAYVSRIGNWYLAITVSDVAMEDCLKAGYAHKDIILIYVEEYEGGIYTRNYLEAMLRK